MRNITLAIDDEVLAAARRYAADRNSTVNALVREYLGNIAQHHDRAAQARANLIELAKKSRLWVGPKTWTRDELHER